MTGIFVFAPEIGRRPPLSKRRPPAGFLWNCGSCSNRCCTMERLCSSERNSCEVTDVNRWDNNLFASGPVGDLPTATCDWSSFPEVELPMAEARRYQLDSGDYLFIRNVYECHRMQYTILNLAGNHPETSTGGKLRLRQQGIPLCPNRVRHPGGCHTAEILALAGGEYRKGVRLLPAWNLLHRLLGCL